MSTSHHRDRAFTLVELLVVIGIIAALIGILLPVLSGVSARGRDIKCQSNLRQIVTAMLNYAAENKGSFPYGFIHNNVDVNANWGPAPGNQGFISWPSQVGRYMVPGASGLNDFRSLMMRGANASPMQCPEAAASFPHHVGYVANMVVCVSPRDEHAFGVPPRAQTRPSLTTLMLKEGTALVWDTALEPGWYNQNIIGYLLSADIDGQRFWSGAGTPQFRYYTTADIFARIPPGIMGQNRPVRLNVGSVTYLNIDPPNDPSPQWPYQGNLRFRHNKNQTCNVGFSDGSVRQFTAKLDSDRKQVKSHDALRKFFMTKWPSGVPANPSQPY